MTNYYKKKKTSAKNVKNLTKKITKNLNGCNFVFASYKMSLKFGEIELHRKEFHRSKQPIYLN